MENYFKEFYKLIIGEIDNALSDVKVEEFDKLIEEILKAKKIFFIGAGQMGIMLSSFCMRLNHLGFKAFLVGSISCPPITNEDLLIVASSSGELPSTLQIVRKANEIGPTIFTITANTDSTIARLSSCILYLKGPSSIEDSEKNLVLSKQPMKTLFSQSLLILTDALVLQLMKVTNQSSTDLAKRHTNLE